MEGTEMDQMLLWALLHEEMSRASRKRKQWNPDDPFWGGGWGVLRTMWPGLDRRPPDRGDVS
jgi:hypothetical protein